MKRTAENQLTKDHHDDDDDVQEIERSSSGLQKADDSALAKRQIRALPKRALAGTAAKAASFNGFTAPPTLAADADKEAPAPPKFGGFLGFGVGASAPSSSFTFSLQPPTTSAPPTSLFGSQTTDAGPRLQPSHKLPQNAVFGSGASSNVSFSTSGMSKSNGPEESDAAALKYYKSLRGLNVSFLSAISKAMDQDPFADMAGLLESYKTLRMTVQSEFDKSSKLVNNTPSTPAGLSSVSGTTSSTSDKPTTPSIFSMPKPPATFINLSAPVPPAKPPSTNEGIFSFSTLPNTKPGGFFFPPPASSSSTASLPFSLALKKSDASMTSPPPAPEFPKSQFGFAPSKPDEPTTSKPLDLSSTTSIPTKPSSDSREKGSEASTATSASFPPMTSVFGSSSGAPNIFAFPKTSPTSSDSDVKATPVFGTSGSIFGSSGDISKPSIFSAPAITIAETGDKSGALKEAAKSSSTSLFGSSTTGSVFGGESPISMFGASSPQKSNTFGFGKPAGSIGNPVGFGFGAPTPKDGGNGSAGSSKPPTGLGVADKPPEGTFSPPPTERSGASTPHPEGSEEAATVTEDDATKQATVDYDAEGQGEEDEETMHSVRCKVFKLVKTDEKQEWKDFGIGMLRLKKHKETKARRILMRNSSTGRILLNFRFFSTFKPSLTKTVISFVTHEEGVPTFCRIRVKTEEQASALKAAMDREMAASLADS